MVDEGTEVHAEARRRGGGGGKLKLEARERCSHGGSFLRLFRALSAESHSCNPLDWAALSCHSCPSVNACPHCKARVNLIRLLLMTQFNTPYRCVQCGGTSQLGSKDWKILTLIAILTSSIVVFTVPNKMSPFEDLLWCLSFMLVSYVFVAGSVLWFLMKLRASSASGTTSHGYLLSRYRGAVTMQRILQMIVVAGIILIPSVIGLLMTCFSMANMSFKFYEEGMRDPKAIAEHTRNTLVFLNCGMDISEALMLIVIVYPGIVKLLSIIPQGRSNQIRSLPDLWQHRHI